MKKDVLFVVDEQMMGGVSVLLCDILKRINISKYNIDVLILHDHGKSIVNDLPKEVRVFYGTNFFSGVDLTIQEALKSSPKKLFSKVSLVLGMKNKKIGKKIMHERKKILDKVYDVEIAFKDGFCALFTAYGDSKKKYHWLHTDYSMYDCTAKYHDLFKEIFPKFDKIIAISNSVLSRFKEKYDVENTDVIFNLIDEEKIRNKSLEKDIHFDEDKINLISVGRIHHMKGYDRLIDVLHELNINNKLENVVVRIIGDGPDFSLVQEKVHQFHLEDKVLLLGQMDNPFPYVKASDAFLMCSRYEPFGLVILEAMILEVPVLSMDVASIREIMNDDYGMIYENSEEGLYNGILEIINNPKKLQKLRKNLRHYKYDIQKIIKQIEDLLDC